MSFVQRSLGSLVLLVVLCAAGIVFSVVYHYHCSSPNMTILDEEEEDLTVLDHQRLRSRDNSHQTNKEGVEKEDVPVWATKYDFVNESAQKHAQEIAKMPDVCFMHVGKTAGTSLRCAFGFKPGYDDCRNTTVPAGYLPQVTTHLSHNRRNFCPQDDSSSSTTRVAASHNHKLPRYYLFATRNPLHRIISWYTYEYPRPDEYPLFYKRKKPLYLDCPFGTLNDLAILGLGESSSASSSDNNNTIQVTAACRRRAWNAIRGREPYSRHNYYNYRWYWSETPPAAPLYVIRTEHLVQDWNSIEAHLHQFLLTVNDNDTQQQQGLVVVGPESFPRSNPTPKTSVTTNNNNNTIHDSSHRDDDDDHHNNKNRALALSPQARALLCRALCQEMQVYRQILHRAVNLTPRDVQVSLQELADSCPAAVEEEPCPPSPHDDDDDSDDRYYWGLLILPILLLLVVVLGWRRRPRQQRKPYSL